MRELSVGCGPKSPLADHERPEDLTEDNGLLKPTYQGTFLDTKPVPPLTHHSHAPILSLTHT